MKKSVGLLLGVVFALLLCTTVFGAEILSVECNKTGVMMPEGNDRIDEVFSFYFIASGDTEKILMNSGKGDSVVSENQFGNKGKDESVGMFTGNFVSGTEGKRVFKFSAVGYDGTVTPYEKEVVLYCYKPTGGEKTVYSADIERDVVKEVVAAHDTIEKVQITICTSLDVKELRLVTETGSVIDGVYQHCKERGGCDIVDGKKYWEVYFVSTILGKRSMSFQAMDNGVPVGDIKTVHYTVLSDEEWDMQNAQGGAAGSGTEPGTDQGFSSGDDENATGNEDGVENGGTGKTDTGTNEGSTEVGENTENSTPDGAEQGKPNGEKDEIKEPEQEEQPEPEKEEDKKQEVNTNTGIGTGNGTNCCSHEDFLSFILPISSTALVIEFPDGEKISAEDQAKKNLAEKEYSRDGKRVFWDVWIGSEYEYDDLEVTVYDENYNPRHDYSIFKTNPLTEKQIAKYEPAIKKELEKRNNPKQKIIKLVIGNEMMTVDGKECEVDPGRGTKPLIIDGRTMLPIRAVVEALGGKVGWDEKERRVDIEVFDRVIKFVIGSLDMTWNNIPEKTDVPPQIINERTMLPVRFVAEALSYTTVSWNETEQSVTITHNY